jgi:hypothetical protein
MAARWLYCFTANDDSGRTSEDFGNVRVHVMAIDIDCFSSNFTTDLHEFFCLIENAHVCRPKLLPIKRKQRDAALAILNRLRPERHVDTAQLCVSIKSTYVYVDSALCDDPEVVHFKLTLSSEHNEESVAVVFDILVAAQLLFELPSSHAFCTVPSTPIENLPADWRSARLCQSPNELQELLNAEVKAHAESLERFRQLVASRQRIDGRQ